MSSLMINFFIGQTYRIYMYLVVSSTITNMYGHYIHTCTCTFKHLTRVFIQSL